MSKHIYSGYLLLSFLLFATPVHAIGLLTSADWAKVYTQTGAISLLADEQLYYAPQWQPHALAIHTLVLDVDHRQGHWQSFFDKDSPPIVFPTVALSGWSAVMKRLRLGGQIQYVPQLKAVSATVATAAQILLGSAERASFFVGLGFGYYFTPQFHFFAPQVFLKWTTEVFRTKTTRRGPWIFYVGARIDQGYRIVRGRQDGATNNHDLMPTWIRALLAVHWQNLQLGYAFGGQQGRILSHSFSVSFIFDKNLH